jgi:twitching motility protein PilJ
MSVTDQLKSLFSKKNPEAEMDANLSLAMPDQSTDIESPETLQVPLAATTQTLAPAKTEQAAPAAAASPNTDLVELPVLGLRSVAQHVRLLGLMLGLSLLWLVGVSVIGLGQSDTLAQQLLATGQAQVQVQRLAKSASQALAGNAGALADVADSSVLLTRTTRGLADGDGDQHLSALPGSLKVLLEPVVPRVDATEKNTKLILQQQKTLSQLGAALQKIARQSAALLEVTQGLAAAKVQQGASAAEVTAAAQLVMLTQRIGKSANEFMTPQGANAETMALLGKDLSGFRDIAQGLLHGSADMRLAAVKDAASREQLEALLKQAEEMRLQGNLVLVDVPGMLGARAALAALLADSEPMRRDLEALQNQLSTQTGLGGWSLAQLMLAALVALLSALGLSKVQKQESRKRQAAADTQRMEAERQEQDAKRVNDANQAAILRLMNELQTVAEGDLTQEATVTEDITGAIADSVNYTVEELRSLVGNVQKTAAQVAQTTSDVDATSTELLAASKEQLHEIRETGQGVLEMAGRINDVSGQAQESARVARQSLLAAESGLTAVQNAIGGMNSIREQIQETSKRIKRLGESSQEIGEITELISDITEQTNVLALNAAIQAASAGDAGRGFSVVAEEVQRLAERSADATRQIAALVKAIQTDTQDAIGAMERSTQGVVEGAKLSDNAGTALTEIDRVSRRVADLIEQISNAASREAGLANEMAENIQHIFAVTEQTGEGTRVTAGQVRALSRMAEELRQSVSRFKIA